MMLLLIVTLVLCVLFCFALYCRFSHYGRMLATIPSPRIWPILGNGLEVIFLNPETSFTYLRNIKKKFGPISKTTSLLISIVHISDPDHVEKLLSTVRYNDKQVPYNFMKSWLCEGLLISNGSKWKQRRRLLTPSFHFSILKGFCSTFNEHTQRLLQRVEQATGNDGTDITPMIARTTLSIMCETSMGTTVNTKDAESIIQKYFNAITAFGNIVQRRIVTFYLHFNWIHKILPLARTEKKLVAYMHSLTNKVIQDRRILRQYKNNNNVLDEDGDTKVSVKEPVVDAQIFETKVTKDERHLKQSKISSKILDESRNIIIPLAGIENKSIITFNVKQDTSRNCLHHNVNSNNDDCFKKHKLAMLDQLLELEEEGVINADGVREEVDTFMFEGHDTTASALEFTIMRIANETKIQEEIYQELCRIFGDSDRLPTVEDLHNMKYLECCIKESLRLYPSVPLIARYVDKDLHLDKYTVPKGAVAFIHVYDIHHDEKLYPDPERFDPDRFLPKNSVQRHPYAYIPFSAGPRNCIGQKFAMYEMKTIMSGLLRRFVLEPVTRTHEVTFVADLVLRPKQALYVRFRRRS